MATARKTEGKNGGSVRVALSLTPDAIRDIDQQRGLVPRATFILDLALRVLTERAERGGKGGGS